MGVTGGTGMMRRVLELLMPRGLLWRFTGDALKLLQGIAVSLDRARDVLMQVIDESTPGTALETLPEWHSTLGVKYDSTVPVEAQRRMLQAMFTAEGGSTLGGIALQIAKEYDGLEIFEKPDAGLEGYWSCEGVPEYPDNPAGTTYVQDEWATTDGWTTGINEGTLSVSGGELINTGVVAGSTISLQKTTGFPTLAGATLRFKMRTNRAYQMRVLYYPGGVATSIGDYLIDSTGTIISVTLPLASTGIRIRSTNASQDGDTFAVDYIYIGDGTYSTQLIDSSGNKRHGTIYGALPVAGVSGKALSKGQVTLPSIPALSQFSVSVWAYVKSGSTESKRVSWSNWIGTGTGWILWAASTNRYMFALSVGTTQYQIYGSVVWPDGWHHFVGTYDGANIRFYVDGVKQGADVALVGWASSNDPVFLSQSISIYPEGYDEPRIYSRALSASEIRYLYNHPGAGVTDEHHGYAIDGTVPTETDALRIGAILAHYAPLHLVPTVFGYTAATAGNPNPVPPSPGSSSGAIENVTNDTAICGISTCGVAVCGAA